VSQLQKKINKTAIFDKKKGETVVSDGKFVFFFSHRNCSKKTFCFFKINKQDTTLQENNFAPGYKVPHHPRTTAQMFKRRAICSTKEEKLI
jgi:hypothetical protein